MSSSEPSITNPIAMSIRLITTYEEAKALKDAGWSRTVPRGGMYYRDGWETPTVADREQDLSSDLSVTLFSSAPRLDELLAFLIATTDQMIADAAPMLAGKGGVDPYSVSLYPKGSEDFEMFKGGDLISCAVAAVLHVLNIERQDAGDA